MRRFLCFLLIFALILPQTFFAAAYARLKTGGSAKVLEVIDGDSIRVQMTQTGENALVRIAGIDSLGYDKAFNYLNSTLVGKTVNLFFDNDTPSYADGKWNYMIVERNGENIAAKLVSLGYAATTAGYNGADASLISSTAAGAQADGRGMWNTDLKYNNAYPPSEYIDGYPDPGYAGSGVNINTALYATFAERMPEIPPSVINSILAYRGVNPFHEVYDICYVPGLTSEMFGKYISIMTVSTNITTATEIELLTLNNITKTEVTAIITHRGKYKFTDTEELYTNGLISESLYKQISNFISIDNVPYLDLSIPDAQADINAAEYDELMKTELNSYQASAIIAGRTDYTYKTLGELMYLPGLYLNAFEVYSFADNLTIAEGEKGGYININFANLSELLKLGLTQAEANGVYAKRRGMVTYKDIPKDIDITRYNGRITLYTNVNRASEAELLGLGIGQDNVNAIMRYRSAHPIGSLDILREIMQGTATTGNYNTFDYIRNFVTIR